jgi:two-component system OmpR family response regulator
MTRILVVDDDPQIRDVVCFALRRAGHETLHASDGAAALVLAASWQPDLVVLDVGMPDLDGLETCRRLRRSSDVPILFLSARDEEVDRVLGLEMGGDDYVTKPFSPRELVARIAAILRRGRRPDAHAMQPFGHGALSLDPASHSMSWAGTPVRVTAIEFAIVRVLLERPRGIVTRDQIITAAYGAAVHVSDRTVDSHVRNIRAKLSQAGCTGAIETVHGLGFRLGDCRAES